MLSLIRVLFEWQLGVGRRRSHIQVSFMKKIFGQWFEWVKNNSLWKFIGSYMWVGFLKKIYWLVLERQWRRASVSGMGHDDQRERENLYSMSSPGPILAYSPRLWSSWSFALLQQLWHSSLHLLIWWTSVQLGPGYLNPLLLFVYSSSGTRLRGGMGNWSTGEEGEWTCSRETDSTRTIFFSRHPHPHSTFWSDCLCLLLTPCSAADSALPVAGPVASTAFWRSIVDHSGCAAPGFHHWDH